MVGTLASAASGAERSLTDNGQPATQHTIRNYSLGVDTEFVKPEDSRRRIIEACAKCWFQKNPSGLNNFNDCSGFLKAVQRELGLVSFAGNANEIAKEVFAREDWILIGRGSQFASEAGAAANAGYLVVALYEEKPNGHVMIITANSRIFGISPEQRNRGSWGQLGKDKVSGKLHQGKTLGRESESFGKPKFDKIIYAKTDVRIA